MPLKNPLRSKIAGEGAWVAIGQLSSALGALAGIRLLTEYVPPDTFGTISLLLGVSTLGSSLFCKPIQQAGLRFYPELSRDGRIADLRHCLCRSLEKTTACLVAALLLGGAIAVQFFRISYWNFVVLAALVAVEVSRGFELDMLSAARRQRHCAIWIGIEAWVRPAFAVLTVIIFGPKPYAILAAYLAASLVLLVICKLTMRMEGCSGFLMGSQYHLTINSLLRQYSLPLLPLAVVAWMTSLSDRYVIGWILGMKSAGIYVACFGLTSKPFLILGQTLLTTVRPVYFEAVSHQNFKRQAKTLRYWLITAVCIFLLGILLISVLKQQLSRYFLAQEYRMAANLMPIIALGQTILCVATIYSTVLLAFKKTWLVFICEASGSISAIVIGIPLIYYFGLTGAAYATPISCSIQLAALWWLSRSFRHMSANENSIVSSKNEDKN